MATLPTLAVSDLINVTVNVSPTAIAGASFSTLLVVGSTGFTTGTTTDRVRSYSNIAGVLADFANTTPEYLAAALYFAQIPTPSSLMIGQKAGTETLVATVQACAAASSAWYAVMIAESTIADADIVAVASYIESTGNRIFGYVTNETAALNTGDTTSVANQLKGLTLSRTVGQYSSSSPYAIAAFFGKALNVDFTANNSTITMMYKQEVLVTAENLTESQAAGAKANNLNVFVTYNNGATIVQYGTVTNGRFFDEVIGLDWLQNAIQTNVFNLLYQNPTKIPQTDAGVGQIVTAVTSALKEAVNNGLVAPGQWNTSGFGALNLGDYLKLGYYVYVAPIATQSQADREARICPPLQVAVKMAGAIHTVAITVNVNR
jgi:Protein of unknown function (DUF3383)